MKWEHAVLSPEGAQKMKDDLEAGDIIGLESLREFLEYASKGEYAQNDKTKLMSLIEVAEAMNPLIIEMEQGERPFDKVYDYYYRDIMSYIYEYLNKIIDQEVL